MSEAEPPREGLPPCLSMTVLDGRFAILLDKSAGCAGQHNGLRFEVAAGREGDLVTWDSHPEMQVRVMDKKIVNVFTDDPDEATVAYERGAEWVRTGELE